jgi:hypothetical protein
MQGTIRQCRVIEVKTDYVLPGALASAVSTKPSAFGPHERSGASSRNALTQVCPSPNPDKPRIAIGWRIL